MTGLYAETVRRSASAFRDRSPSESAFSSVFRRGPAGSKSSIAATFVRQITAFLRNGDGTWRRDDERHVYVLPDTSRIPELLDPHDLEAHVGTSLAEQRLPDGLVTVVGRKKT